VQNGHTRHIGIRDEILERSTAIATQKRRSASFGRRVTTILTAPRTLTDLPKRRCRTIIS
jgi:hypothetical protein